MDSQTNEGYKGEGQMFQLAVAWAGKTYGFYYGHEVEHTRQHHRYPTKPASLKA